MQTPVASDASSFCIHLSSIYLLISASIGITFYPGDGTEIDTLLKNADQALCDAIIVMAHKLGIKVVAEGVETELQRQLLAASKCDYAQGYLFSQSVPAEEFEQLF